MVGLFLHLDTFLLYTDTVLKYIIGLGLGTDAQMPGAQDGWLRRGRDRMNWEKKRGWECFPLWPGRFTGLSQTKRYS